MSFGKFRGIPRMHSWQNWRCVAGQFFLRKTIRIFKIVPSTKEIFSKSSTGHIDFNFWTLVETFCQKLEFFHSKSTNRVKIMFLFEKETFCLKVILSTYGMQFWHLWRFCFTRNPKHSRSEPKTLKSFSSSKKVWFGTSPGHLECLPDEPGVFLQINVSSEKPW